jgi:glycosyltransferase involved in cell wall biosynthesis
MYAKAPKVSRLKILRVISSVNPTGGGPIEGVLQSSTLLINQGHLIELASLDSPDEDYLMHMPIVTHALGPAKGAYAYSTNFQLWLNEHVADYNVVLVQGLWQYCGYATRQACIKNNVPYYVFTHGMLDPWFKKTYPLKHLKKWLYWPCGEYRVLRDAKQVFFTTEEEKLLARHSFWLYQCNEQVLSYGTAGYQGDKVEQQQLFLQQQPHLKDKSFLLFLSRIHPKKGIDILIKSFAAQQSLLGETELVIAGPDQVGWQAELEQLAITLGVAHKITWTGMLSGDLKWGAYHCADAFILPSHQENFGIVVAEALSCNVPVLISNKVNIWREIQAEAAGFVADDTLEGCNALIGQWQQQTELEKNTLRINARQCFLKHFEINQAAQSLILALSLESRL